MAVAAALTGGGAASAASLSLQLETGVTSMAKPADDIFVEYKLPGGDDHVHFNSFTYGAALRLDTQRVVLSAGWRDLGNQHDSANIISDGAYFACRGGKVACTDVAPWPRHWISTGDMQQRYASVGYKFHLGTFAVVPTIGMSDNFSEWHFKFWSLSAPSKVRNATEPNEQSGGPFAGFDVERSRYGFGVYLLDTHPTWCADGNFDGQGAYAIYARITYAIGGKP